MSEQVPVRGASAQAGATVAAVAVCTAALAGAAHAGAVALLVAVAALQAAIGLSWVLGVGVPGREGALAIGVLAAIGADVSVSLFPQGRLEPLLPVLGLALSAMFVQQLARRSRRAHVSAALGRICVLVCLEVAPTALLQLRAEFGGDAGGGTAVAAAALTAGCAVGVAALVDLVLPALPVDPAVRRGVPALLSAAAVGAAVGYASLGGTGGMSAGAAAGAGAVIGLVAALLGVAAAFLAAGGVSGSGRGAALLYGLAPMTLVAPVALLVLLALRG
jgi:hypothetical protein